MDVFDAAALSVIGAYFIATRAAGVASRRDLEKYDKGATMETVAASFNAGTGNYGDGDRRSHSDRNPLPHNRRSRQSSHPHLGTRIDVEA